VGDDSYIIIGRAPDCDLVLTDPTVSSRHLRLAWKGAHLVVEDLGSANGTYVRNKRVDRVEIRPGESVRLGRYPLPWGNARMRAFLRRGASGQTIEATSIPGRRFICGVCGERALMPEGFGGGELQCPACGSRLTVGAPRSGGVPGLVGAIVALIVVAGGATVWVLRSDHDALVQKVAQRARESTPFERALQSSSSPQEASIRVHTVPGLVDAMDYRHPTTRNTAVRIAADEQGPYRLEQMALLWTHVRGRWRYVNDPRGGDYFAKASETIENEYAGDCDDFAVLLVSLISAIGGEARVVIMDGPRGGHAYAEACVRHDADEVRQRLAVHYRRTWDKYLGRQQVQQLHYRPGEECPLWLNLDWNAGVPGGPYEPERWAVAVYKDGTTQTLAPAGSGDPAEDADGPVQASSPPRR
jgi:hypothetical protein